MKLLQQLWELADREMQKTQGADAFEMVGLWLFRPLTTRESFSYQCTPINSLTFAHTSGGGVHFGFLKINGEVNDESPICMTVPMNCGDVNGNIILGSNFHEFLCLGCETGYFYLESLANKWDGSNFKFSYPYHPGHWVDIETEQYNAANVDYQQKLNLLVTEFKLKPLANPVARLIELQQQYQPLIQLKEDD